MNNVERENILARTINYVFLDELSCYVILVIDEQGVEFCAH